MTDLDKLKDLVSAGEKAERCFGKNPRICWAIPCNLGKECKQKARYKMDSWHIREDLPAIIAKYERMEEALDDAKKQMNALDVIIYSLQNNALTDAERVKIAYEAHENINMPFQRRIKQALED